MRLKNKKRWCCNCFYTKMTTCFFKPKLYYVVLSNQCLSKAAQSLNKLLNNALFCVNLWDMNTFALSQKITTVINKFHVIHCAAKLTVTFIFAFGLSLDDERLLLWLFFLPYKLQCNCCKAWLGFLITFIEWRRPTVFCVSTLMIMVHFLIEKILTIYRMLCISLLYRVSHNSYAMFRKTFLQTSNKG